MKLGYNLTLEQQQKLIITPELRQAIELLQFNSQELNEFLLKQIEENPVLDVESSAEVYEDIDHISSEKEEIDWKEYLGNVDNYTISQAKDKNTKDYSFDNFVSFESTLKETLLFQLNVLGLNDLKSKIGRRIIENIDDNGYLEASLEEISKELKVSLDEVKDLLLIVQNFEPLGVGARDLKECLLLQIEADPHGNQRAKEIVANYLEDLAYNRITKISRELKLEPYEIQEICDYIKTLEPKPGRGYESGTDNIRYITPDAYIEYIDGEYIVILNDIVTPRLNISNFYKDIVKKSKDENATEYLTGKLNSAMWVIKSIEQRRETIFKVVSSILKYQRDFFDKGEKHLHPLTLKEVAEDIDMHESTVSRATSGKYVQSPRGLFELKYFFTSGLSTSQGEDVSSTSIKASLKDIIDNENPKKPYSDNKIKDLLNEKGVKISRRTVAKYRDELEIPCSTARKRY